MHSGNSFRFVAVIFLLLTFCTSGFSQTISESLFSLNKEKQQQPNQKMISLEKLIKKIESDQHIIFLYKTMWLEDKYVPANTLEQDSLEFKLGDILQKEGLTYSKITPRSYAIQPQTDMGDTSKKSIQVETVSGTVTDAESGETLPGVNISVKGTSTGTSTDIDGNFELNVSSLQDTLILTYIGYQRQEVPINGRTEIQFTLQPQAIVGEELVIVGYGTQRRSDLTGSIKSLGEESIQSAPIATPEQALQGRIAGVQVKKTFGAKPGASMSVRIRGYNSINSNGEPLYVIDGFPGVGNLKTINAADIKSIDVLKDASATAIYGARGANGVVIITTKKGTSGQTQVDLNYSVGVQNVSKKFDLLNATEFAKYTNLVSTMDGNPPVFENPSSFGEGTDWQEEIFRPAPIQNLHFGVRGGTSKTNYAISGGYFSQEGIVLGSGLNRGDIRLNFDSNISKKIEAGASVYIAETKNDEHDTSLISAAAIVASPILSIKNDEGRYMTNADLGAEYGYPFYSKGNAVAMAKEIEDIRRNTHVLGNAYLRYDITNNLSFKTSFGSDLAYDKFRYYVPDGTPYNTGGAGSVNSGGTAELSTSNYLSWVNENTLSYIQDFENQNISIVAGATFQKTDFANLTASAQSFTDDYYKYNNLSLGNQQNPSESSATSSFLNSYFIRANYQLLNKYLVTLTTRADGSSKFGKNHKFGFFPSGALAWRISEEPFLNGVQAISDLKLRASYGITGNEGIGSYQSLARIGGTEYIFGDSRVVGATPISIANQNLKWEKTAQFNTGIDVDLFSHRLSVTADYYHKTTSDLLLSVIVPYTSGFSTALQNIGKVSNQGLEFSINSINIQSNNLAWDTGFNISFNRNNVLDLGESDEIISNGYLWYFGSYSIAREGQPVGLFYNYKMDGIWQPDDDIANSAQPNAQPGDQKYVDINNDGTINAQDRTIIGNPHPDFTFGFTSNLNWKNFDLSILLEGSYGNDVMNASYIDNMIPNATTNITTDTFYNIWTQENRSNTHIRGGFTIDPSSSSMYLENGSYLRVNNIMLGYSIPNSLSSKLDISKLRLYASVQNLYTFTNYSGYNPEANRFGGDNLRLGYANSFYPSARTINLGINLEF